MVYITKLVQSLVMYSGTAVVRTHVNSICSATKLNLHLQKFRTYSVLLPCSKHEFALPVV
jgi:hypothetical protein